MNRDSYFNRPKQTTTEDIEGFGPVILRKLTQAEVEHARKHYGTPDKALPGYRYIVTRAVVDAEGQQVFTDADQVELANADYEIIEQIATAAMRFGGLIKDDPKARSAD